MIAVLLWPFAYKYAELLHNNWHLDENGLSPSQKFCGTEHRMELKDIHTWGCPCYVLDSKLQTNKMMNKWEPRSRLGIYLGHSPCHAGSVALVLNPRTLHVSPQFHVVFDDNFTTVPYLSSHDIPPNWSDLLKNSEDVSDENYDLAQTWMKSAENTSQFLQHQEGELEQIVEKENHTTVLFDLPSEKSKDSNRKDHIVSEGEKNIEMLLEPTLPDINELTSRRTSRMRTPSQKARDSTDRTVKKMFGLATILHTIESFNPQRQMYAFVNHLQNINKLFDDTINQSHFYIFNAVAETNDVYTLSQMLKLKDIKDFVVAMVKEIDDHESRGHWELVEHTKIPKGAKTILSVWAFKRKRLPDGTILKHKARLNAHGGMQRWGIDYYETYAPVVNWISVRILLALSIIHKLESKSIDFVLAFPQADLERERYLWNYHMGLSLDTKASMF